MPVLYQIMSAKRADGNPKRWVIESEGGTALYVTPESITARTVALMRCDDGKPSVEPVGRNRVLHLDLPTFREICGDFGIKPDSLPSRDEVDKAHVAQATHSGGSAP